MSIRRLRRRGTVCSKCCTARIPSATYHLGKDLAGVEQTAGGVTARFADGTVETADLLVGADGFRSAVRALLLPDVLPQYAGYIAWRGMAPETLFREPADQHRFDLFTFTLPPGEQMLGYPVAGVNNDMRRGHRSYNFVWYLPADEARDVPRLLTDRNGHTHTLSIPPPLIAPDVVSEMRAHASKVLSPWFQRVVNIIEQPFLQPIYDLTSPRMAFGRIALVGDAAFVIRPHVGAGVVKAAEDAAALARVLGMGGDIAARLEAYSTERSIVGNRIVEQARRLGCYLKHSFATDAERRYAEERGAPMTVLKETGSLAFMRA